MGTHAVAELPGTLVHPAVAGARRLTATDMWRILRVGAPVPSPDGRRCVVPVTTHEIGDAAGVTRLWHVDTDGGEPRPITAEAAIATAPAWSPDGLRLAYLRKPVDEPETRAQLHMLRLDGGETSCLTDTPLGVLDAVWLHDGSGLVVASPVYRDHPTIDATAEERARREDDPVKAHATEGRLFRFWDRWLTGGEVPHLFHLDLADGSVRDLTPQSTGWLDFMEPRGLYDVAPDGSEVAWAAIVIDDERDEIVSRVYRVALQGGEPECITADAPADALRPRYTPDGAAIIYGRKEDRYFYADRPRLHRFDRSSGTHAPWCDSWDRSPMQWEVAGDGTLLFTAEHGARTNVYALAPDATEPQLVAEGGTLSSVRPSGDGAVWFSSQSLQQPPEVFRCASGESGDPQRITRFTEPALAGIALGEVRELHVDGAEGEPVQSFIVLPPGETTGMPAPFVNVVHGGPHGISADGFHFRWNAHLFAAPGYVVAMPNFQGSTSWGNDYAQRIQGAWGDRPFRDVLAVTDALVESGVVDPERMAAAGGSYGGYMMAWIAGQTDRFACIVNHAGVYNTLSMYASDVTQGRPRSFGGEPWSGLEAIDRYNPARFTAAMKTPMLVIHGEQDYRVPVTQGLECYGVLKAKGVPVRLLHFPDENHWVLKPHNSIRWYAEVESWLERWLGPAGG